MSDDLVDWADVGAVGIMLRSLHDQGWRVLNLIEILSNPSDCRGWLMQRNHARTAAAIREAYENGMRYQRSKDVAICKALSETLDPCHDVSNAADCQRAIENRLSPEEAARRVRNGESLDA